MPNSVWSVLRQIGATPAALVRLRRYPGLHTGHSPPFNFLAHSATCINTKWRYSGNMSAGLRTVILLSFVLAIGFLLVILSCALWGNWLPILVALTFILAPLPNSICSRVSRGDDFGGDYNSAYVDFGRFLTGMLVTTGLSLPLLLTHASLIQPAACWMSIAGGGLVYGTILVYSGWFGGNGGDDDY